MPGQKALQKASFSVPRDINVENELFLFKDSPVVFPLASARLIFIAKVILSPILNLF